MLLTLLLAFVVFLLLGIFVYRPLAPYSFLGGLVVVLVVARFSEGLSYDKLDLRRELLITPAKTIPFAVVWLLLAVLYDGWRGTILLGCAAIALAVYAISLIAFFLGRFIAWRRSS
jgi:hypothetical protein